MKFLKLSLLIFICFLLAGSFVGCSTFSDSSKPNTLEPQAILKFSDVPVPVGLKQIPQDSYSFESSGIRVGVLKYQGKGNADQITNFYKEQMTMYNWNLINIVEYGQRLINFDRETESCIINLEPKGSSIILTIFLGPKSQATAKRSRTPIR
ncbi:MAG: hypothetical protein WC543_05345 [Candidatus Omnitrophota bacterium]